MTHPFDPEQVDLRVLAEALERRFASTPVAGYVLGRTTLRDAIIDELDCSELESENIVETMISRGFLRYEGDATETEELADARWSIHRRSVPPHL